MFHCFLLFLTLTPTGTFPSSVSFLPFFLPSFVRSFLYAVGQTRNEKLMLEKSDLLEKQAEMIQSGTQSVSIRYYGWRETER